MEEQNPDVIVPPVVTGDTPTDATVENATEATPVETQEADPSPEKEDKQPPKWAQKRINELTRDKYRERAQREMLETRLAEIESRLQAQPGVEGDSPAHQPAGKPEAELLRQAEARVAFDMKCNDAFKQGTKEFGSEFEDALGNLKMVGIDANALGVIVESDEPHKVLKHLGDNPDEASRILGLNPVAMARAIGALEVRLSQPKPTPAQSKAPAPITPVSARSASSTGLGDELSMDEWIKRRNLQVRGK
jgi:hypothetical protein